MWRAENGECVYIKMQCFDAQRDPRAADSDVGLQQRMQSFVQTHRLRVWRELRFQMIVQLVVHSFS